MPRGRSLLAAAIVAALYVAVALRGGGSLDVWLGLALVTMLVPVALVDLERRIIPNAVVGPAAAVALVLLAALDPGELPEHVVAGLAAGGLFLLAAVASPEGMGMGDVKLAGTLGFYLGRAVAPAVLVALVLGVTAGVAIMVRRGVREGRKAGVPFGPFLALGGLAGLFAGDALVDW